MRLENSFCLIFLEEFPTFLNCLSFTINGYIYQQQTTGERERVRQTESGNQTKYWFPDKLLQELYVYNKIQYNKKEMLKKDKNNLEDKVI